MRLISILNHLPQHLQKDTHRRGQFKHPALHLESPLEIKTSTDELVSYKAPWSLSAAEIEGVVNAARATA